MKEWKRKRLKKLKLICTCFAVGFAIGVVGVLMMFEIHCLSSYFATCSESAFFKILFISCLGFLIIGGLAIDFFEKKMWNLIIKIDKK